MEFNRDHWEEAMWACLHPPRLGWFIHIPFLAHSMCWGLGGAVMEYNDRRRHSHPRPCPQKFCYVSPWEGCLRSPQPGAPPILLKDKIKRMTAHWFSFLCTPANVPGPAQVPHTVPQPSQHTSACVTTVSPGCLACLTNARLLLPYPILAPRQVKPYSLGLDQNTHLLTSDFIPSPLCPHDFTPPKPFPISRPNLPTHPLFCPTQPCLYKKLNYYAQISLQTIRTTWKIKPASPLQNLPIL